MVSSSSSQMISSPDPSISLFGSSSKWSNAEAFNVEVTAGAIVRDWGVNSFNFGRVLEANARDKEQRQVLRSPGDYTGQYTHFISLLVPTIQRSAAAPHCNLKSPGNTGEALNHSVCKAMFSPPDATPWRPTVVGSSSPWHLIAEGTVEVVGCWTLGIWGQLSAKRERKFCTSRF